MVDGSSDNFFYFFIYFLWIKCYKMNGVLPTIFFLHQRKHVGNKNASGCPNMIVKEFHLHWILPILLWIRF